MIHTFAQEFKLHFKTFEMAEKVKNFVFSSMICFEDPEKIYASCYENFGIVNSKYPSAKSNRNGLIKGIISLQLGTMSLKQRITLNIIFMDLRTKYPCFSTTKSPCS